MMEHESQCDQVVDAIIPVLLYTLCPLDVF